MSSKKPTGPIQAGNVRKALVLGLPYILEFTGPDRARAYTRKANNTKDKYAGEFTKGPPASINPNVKENNVKIVNGVEEPRKQALATPEPRKQALAPPEPRKQAPTANAKTNTKKNKNKNNKKVTVAKKTVKATAAKKPVAPPPYTGYFQKQEGAGCGRHALNNLFGRMVFEKGSTTDTYVHGTSKEPYSLLGICNTLETTFKKKGLKQACLASENYDTNTMLAAVDILGYETEAFHPSDMLDESGDFVGFLINLGLIKGRIKHWIALKFKEINDQGITLYDYYDSLNSRPVEDITYNVFAAQHPETYIIKVLKPKGVSKNPVDRLALLANAAPPSPKVKKTAAAANTCSILYDPCTKQPLKDMAALEARIAEIKAKQVKI